jgi:hypothetical protein
LELLTQKELFLGRLVDPPLGLLTEELFLKPLYLSSELFDPRLEFTIALFELKL